MAVRTCVNVGQAAGQPKGSTPPYPPEALEAQY